MFSFPFITLFSSIYTKRDFCAYVLDCDCTRYAWLIRMKFGIRIYKTLHAHHAFLKYWQNSSILFNKSIRKIYELPEFKLQKFMSLLYPFQ